LFFVLGSSSVRECLCFPSLSRLVPASRTMKVGADLGFLFFVLSNRECNTMMSLLKAPSLPCLTMSTHASFNQTSSNPIYCQTPSERNGLPPWIDLGFSNDPLPLCSQHRVQLVKWRCSKRASCYAYTCSSSTPLVEPSCSLAICRMRYHMTFCIMDSPPQISSKPAHDQPTPASWRWIYAKYTPESSSSLVSLMKTLDLGVRPLALSWG
jgi:hypothetical protein